MTHEVKLNRIWTLGTVINRGGFGDVYEAVGDDGSPAVMKLVPKSPGADRELLFENLSGAKNVIPILDSGEFENRYAIAMPRAEKSLQERLNEVTGGLDVEEAVAALLDVAEALASLSDDVVHRDLKPGNVLLYQGHWCLADFGIARYADATTSPDTHKYSMTPPFAAPEQWRHERATSATDIYALGVMAHYILAGELPFPGPDFRDQHLHANPPKVLNCPTALVTLVTECL